MSKPAPYLLWLLWSFAVSTSAIASKPLEFSNAYIAAAPPGAHVMAAYMSINNPTRQERSIASISSNDFASVEIHRSIIKNDQARMEAIDQLTIPARSQLTLRPGGLHLMLIEPQKPLLVGESVILKLLETNGSEHHLLVKVRNMENAVGLRPIEHHEH